MSNPEAISEDFNLSKFLKARELTIKAVETIANRIEVGMTEEDGFKVIDSVLSELGAEKKWHPHKFRIGINTTKAFKEVSEPDVKLKENDIFFIDIGPVFDGYEGDFGKTFTVGSNSRYLEITKHVEQIFLKANEYWFNENPTGVELYDFLEKTAKELGYILNTAMNGHRLSDFPHAIYHRGKLQDFQSVPMENLWVLEVLIIRAFENYGAFYEDIIKKPTY